MKCMFCCLVAAASIGVFGIAQSDVKPLENATRAMKDVKAPYSSSQFNMACVYALLTGEEVASFDVLKSRVETVAEQTKFSSEEQKAERTKYEIINQGLWRFNGKFIPDAYAFAKANGIENCHFAPHAAKLGMSESEELSLYFKLFQKASKNDLWIWKSKQGRFFELLKKQPAEDQKKMLSDLNWAYSAKITEDEAAFTPVVKQIRTMLELVK